MLEMSLMVEKVLMMASSLKHHLLFLQHSLQHSLLYMHTTYLELIQTGTSQEMTAKELSQWIFARMMLMVGMRMKICTRTRMNMMTRPQTRKGLVSLVSAIMHECTYCILLKISPPFFSSRHGPDWGGGLFSNMSNAPRI